MRVIIAGSRDYTPIPEEIEGAVEALGFKPSLVISGCCGGADKAGEEWAAMNGVPVEHHPAKWSKHGKKAGPIRNLEMAKCADALIAFHKGDSPGTADMIRHAKKHGLKTFVVHI